MMESMSGLASSYSDGKVGSGVVLSRRLILILLTALVNALEM
jgi:hypothetical protein